ncbi:vacuolar fusion protein ccz1 [Homalodisca vitripennis]|nr:vacuolar fusion protein ccz1 [Homalodisca vitripennis]
MTENYSWFKQKSIETALPEETQTKLYAHDSQLHLSFDPGNIDETISLINSYLESVSQLSNDNRSLPSTLPIQNILSLQKMQICIIHEVLIRVEPQYLNKRLNTGRAVAHSLHSLIVKLRVFQGKNNWCLLQTVNVPTRTSVEGKTYHGDEVQDSVCLAVVKQAYLMYRLFHGTFSSLLDSSGGDTTPLKQRLESFFNRHLPTIKLQHCDIMDIFQGVQFLPLDKQTFLHIQCFVNLLEASFPVVEFTAFLYNDRLICGLEPEDMQVVFHYLVYTLLPKFSETEAIPNGSVPTLSSYGSTVFQYLVNTLLPKTSESDAIPNWSVPTLSSYGRYCM